MIHRCLGAAIALAAALTMACNDADGDPTANVTGPFETPAHPAGMERAVAHDTYSSVFEAEPVQDGKPIVLE